MLVARIGGAFFALACVLGVSAIMHVPPDLERPAFKSIVMCSGLCGFLAAVLIGNLRWSRTAGLAGALVIGALAALQATAAPLILALLIAAATGQLLLLIGFPGMPRLALGTATLLVAMGGLATCIHSPLTPVSPLEELALELEGALHPGEVTRALGVSTDYRLTLPSSGWRKLVQRTAEGVKAPPDAAWILPLRGARIVARVKHSPGAGFASTEDLQTLLLEVMEADGSTDVEVLGSEALSGPFDVAHRFHVVSGRDGSKEQAYVSLAVRGDQVLIVAALAPTHRFEAVAPELAAILGSLAWDAPKNLMLRQETLARVRRSTGMVLTTEGSGTGVVVAVRDNVSFVATNDHVVRCGDGKPCAELAVVLPDASNDPALHEARILSSDPLRDLALLEVRAKGSGAPPAPGLQLRHGASLPERSPLFVVGYPFGLLMGGGKSFPAATVNAGWLGSETPADQLEKGRLAISAGINPGNSGGPVVDGAGRVVGLAVERIPGTETGVMISSNTLDTFYREVRSRRMPALGFDPSPVPEDALVERLIGSEEARAQAATVALRSGTRGTAGVVVGRLGDRAVVLASAAFVDAPEEGHPLPEVRVKVRPESSASTWEASEILRVNFEQGLMLLAVRGVPDSVEPLTPVRTRYLEQLSGMSVLGFRVRDDGTFTQSAPQARTQYGSLASIQRDEKGEPEFLHVDVGINHGMSGGVAIDGFGRLVGLTGARVEGTNLTLVTPGEVLSGFLRGGVSSGGWIFQRTSSGRCSVKAMAVVSDPLGTLKSAALRFGDDGQTWDLRTNPRHAPALGVAPATEVEVAGRDRIELVAEVPCPKEAARVQLQLTDAEGELRTTAALIPIEGVTTLTLRGRFGGTWLQEGDPADVLEFLLLPSQPLPGWRGECLAEGEDACEQSCRQGHSEACLTLGLGLGARNDRKGAESLFDRACRDGNVDGCAELAFVKARSHAPLEGETLRALAKHCDSGYLRACIAMKAREFLRLIPLDEDACELLPAACLRLGYARMYGPGGVDTNLARILRAFRRACDGNDRDGCFAMAVLMLEQGKAAGEAPEAVAHLQSGCNVHGHAPSCLSLATLHATGEGLARDLKRAREYVRRACSLKDRGACMLHGEDLDGGQ